jgi:hypothetical protein
MKKQRKLFSYVMTGALSVGIIGGVGSVPTFAATNTEAGQHVEMDVFPKLDEETQAKVKAIFDQVKAGTLTKEEAQKQLTELGVDLPAKGERGFGGAFAKLDEETQAKVKAIFDQVKEGALTEEEAQKQLTELGVDLPEKGERGFGGAFAELDEETQAKVKAIFDQVKAGTLTQEDAEKQLAELGVDIPMKGDKQLEETEDESSL